MSDISWPASDEEALLAAHREAMLTQCDRELDNVRKRLATLPAAVQEKDRERIGKAVLRTLEAAALSESIHESAGGIVLTGGKRCQPMERPVFTVESPQQETWAVYSRANADAGTLEVAARAGTLNGESHPSSDDMPFPMAYNRATASIGAPIAIPTPGSATHGPTAILEVDVELQIENIWSHAPVAPGTARHLIWTVPGDGDLPLRGNALAWCRAGLTVVGVGGSRSRSSVLFVSAWVNRDGEHEEDRAPGGVVTLRHTVAVGSALLVAGIFVDITCFAAAEESKANPARSAYAELKCARGDGYPVPSRLRLMTDRTRVRLCEMPLILA